MERQTGAGLLAGTPALPRPRPRGRRAQGSKAPLQASVCVQGPAWAVANLWPVPAVHASREAQERNSSPPTPHPLWVCNSKLEHEAPEGDGGEAGRGEGVPGGEVFPLPFATVRRVINDQQVWNRLYCQISIVARDS